MRPGWLLTATLVGAVGLWGALRLALDIGWDRPMGRRFLVLVLCAALLPIPSRLELDVDAAIARCAIQLVQRLQAGAPVVDCGASPFRDRWLRRLPFRAVEVEASAPPRKLPAGAVPGTFLITRSGPAGWVSAVTMRDGRADFFSIDGRRWVGAFTGGER